MSYLIRTASDFMILSHWCRFMLLKMRAKMFLITSQYLALMGKVQNDHAVGF